MLLQNKIHNIMMSKKVPFCLRPFVKTLEPFSCYLMFVQLPCTRRRNIITSPKTIKINITLGISI